MRLFSDSDINRNPDRAPPKSQLFYPGKRSLNLGLAQPTFNQSLTVRLMTDSGWDTDVESSPYGYQYRLLSPCKGGDPAAGSPTATLLRLHPSHRSLLRRLPLIRVGSPTSGANDFHGVTGGVYKAWERIHRGMLIRDY